MNDERWLALAQHVAQWSKDPSTTVGCVIVDTLGRVRGLGYNGFPRGVADDHRLHDRELKLEMIVHAEANAILNATSSVQGCVAYTWPFPPCSRCAGLLIQAGIARVVSPMPSPELELRWGKSLRVARTMMLEAHMIVEWRT